MLEPEKYYGNIEYKRYFKNININRFNELTTQMNFRLNEGEGICYYYIGVNDDGSIYNTIKKKEKTYSINILKKMACKCEAMIDNIKSVDTYMIIKVIKKYMNDNLDEYNILFIGDTNTYKTTMIANIVKGKNDKNYIVNHKHEIESGCTSSMNYYPIEYKNKILIFDSPGNDKYHKTLLKMVKSIKYDFVIFTSGDEWKYFNYFTNYFNKIETQYINYNKNINIIDKNEFIKIIDENIIFKQKKIFSDNDKVLFNVLQTFVNENGILLSGYLMNGIIKINKEYFYYKNLSNKKFKIKIVSIHGSNNNDSANIPLICINKSSICTINISSNEIIFDKKIKYGYISDR